jgi:hypothetical protein
MKRFETISQAYAYITFCALITDADVGVYEDVRNEFGLNINVNKAISSIHCTQKSKRTLKYSW